MTAATSTGHETNNFYAALEADADAIVARYRAATPRSAALHARASTVMPGGFTRDAIMRSPYAPFVAKGEGSILTDADDRRVVDLWFNATSLPLGHAHPAVVAAAQAQVERGTAYFAPTEVELDWADTLLARLPSAEQIRFANSGSEAVMIALRIARAHAGRDLVVKFEGSYHGSYDDVSWSVGPPAGKLGPADAPEAVAESGGLVGAQGRVLVLPFNDADALATAVERRKGEIGVIIVEPMANRMGLIMPEPAFLERARALADRHGIVLIFDEVIAFRIGYNGAQGVIGIEPDLTTLGKIIGGGFPVGAIAGRADILAVSRPDAPGRVTHAGTFNANPVTAAAGKATLEALTPEVFDRINTLGSRIRQRLEAICDGRPLQVTGAGSLFKVTATDRPIRNYRDAVTANKRWEALASLALLTEGYLLTPTLSGCVSAVTTDADADGFLDAFARVVEE